MLNLRISKPFQFYFYLKYLLVKSFSFFFRQVFHVIENDSVDKQLLQQPMPILQKTYMY